jgi:hypothetical protein
VILVAERSILILGFRFMFAEKATVSDLGLFGAEPDPLGKVYARRRKEDSGVYGVLPKKPKL